MDQDLFNKMSILDIDIFHYKEMGCSLLDTLWHMGRVRWAWDKSLEVHTKSTYARGRDP